MHIFKADKVELVKFNRVVLKFNSQDVEQKDDFVSLVERVRTALCAWYGLDPQPIVVEELLEEGVKAEFLELLGD